MPTRTNEEICTALRNAKGLITVAARQLEVSRKQIYSRIKSSEDVKEALDEARDFTTDVAEARLFTAIDEGEPWAVCFYLKCQAKNRGYVERQERTGEGGGPILLVDVEAVRDRVITRIGQMRKRITDGGNGDDLSVQDAEFEVVG